MVVFKKVSADEAQTKRHELRKGADIGGTITKAAKAPASWNKEKRSARFIMTTEQVDRYGDIVTTKGGDITEFLRNPVGLLFHNSRTWPVAKWANVEAKTSGRPPRMEGDFELLPEGGPVKEVDETAWMIENGGIRACSIGFIPDWDQVDLILDDDEEWVTGWRFNAWELTECSVCAVPANPGALVKSAHGDMNLAQELLEDVLDNWVKTPEGLLLSRQDFEAAYNEVKDGKRSINSVQFAGMTLDLEANTLTKAADVSTTDTPATEEQKSDAELETASVEAAEAEEAKDVEFGDDVADLIKSLAAGDVVAINAGSVFTGIKDGTVTLSQASGGHAKIVHEDGTEDYANLASIPEGLVKAIDDHLESLKGAPVEPVVETIEEVPESVVTDKFVPDASVPTTIGLELELDTAAAEEAITKVDGLLTKLFSKFPNFFQKSEKEAPVHIEPVIVAPASPAAAEDISAAVARAAAVKERLAAKGLITEAA